ncbi:wall-associated receptor kinase-like 1 [Magnolia sinica]|uniref:wall-associated receptor kinase-like 1 n=1 Tax=Magnolia sinica TaxID=86752 RepID=UPI0026599C0E|nr:wall-associated receptor kinase-like 1 [Magnolia sinica]
MKRLAVKRRGIFALNFAVWTLLCIGSIALCLFGCCWVQRKSNLANVRAKHFTKNGGILLQRQFSSLHGSTRSPKIYSTQELKQATNNYHSTNILSSGGNGSVYKGILKDGSVVAVKKSQVVDKSHIDQFINEVVILTEINHRNVVKLLGCCLETQVPMLVYEFISNGTLCEKIHESDDPLERISWQSRFRIAVKTAGALSYLHSSTSTPIFHRDVKSSNILLDKNYTPKVADFGISRLVPLDKTKVSTMVLGTFGYLDPEYFNTGNLTEKSDVYSFGVVLLELLTGRKPICPHSSIEYHNLPMVFLSYVRNDNFVEILDDNVACEGKMEELQAVADLPRRCLRVKGGERPTMKEVKRSLEDLRVFLLFNCDYHLVMAPKRVTRTTSTFPPEIPVTPPETFTPPSESSATPTVSVSADQLQQMLQTMTGILQRGGRNKKAPSGSSTAATGSSVIRSSHRRFM